LRHNPVIVKFFNWFIWNYDRWVQIEPVSQERLLVEDWKNRWQFFLCALILISTFRLSVGLLLVVVVGLNFLPVVLLELCLGLNYLNIKALFSFLFVDNSFLPKFLSSAE
jgi:hypothetical protein